MISVHTLIETVHETHSRFSCSPGITDTSALEILREARDIVSKQDAEQWFWVQGSLNKIAGLQVRAHDYEGAIQTLREYAKDPNFDATIVDLAEALARSGQSKRAFEILRLTPDYAKPYYYSHGTVQLKWVEYLIETGKLDLAVQAVRQTTPDRYRQEGEVKLALAYARFKNAAQVSVHLRKAFDLAIHLSDESDRVSALLKIADAQLKIGRTSAVRDTIKQLTESQSYHNGWTAVDALCQSAVLTAKLQDRQTARRLFRRALENYKMVDKRSLIDPVTMQMYRLSNIAEEQASAGFLQDALNTAASIKHSAEDFTIDTRREEALYCIACKQAELNDVKSAVTTALSIKYCVQYRDDALDAMVERSIDKNHLASALAATDRFLDTMRKAAAVLRVATAYTRSGNRQRAREIAARIKLKPNEFAGASRSFDYRQPETWGVDYNATGFYSNGQHAASVQRTTALASSAMTLSQALDRKPVPSYAIAFRETSDEIVGPLARIHARYGIPAAALEWARKIGSSDRVKGFDTDAIGKVKRRVNALCGVAEGMLDRYAAPVPSDQR